MPETNAEELALRRELEDTLIELGVERERLARQDGFNRERIRRLVGPAREAGITVRDVARMTGLSTQTLHTWMTDLMRPIPDIHFGLAGPVPAILEQSVLRAMGEDPAREWTPVALVDRIPAGWPSGEQGDVASAMERLARGHMIWDGVDDGSYRVSPPA
jgi:hypothetical protein